MGNGVSADSHAALHWYLRAAKETKEVDAILKVADMYESGEGCDASETDLAFEFYQAAAEQGHPEGQHKMGMAYWRGLFHRPINLGEAVMWFTKAASEKYAASSWALGQMALENGDQDVAIAWWHKSIALGHVPSMRALASLLLNTTNDNDQDLPDEKEDGTKFNRAMELLAEAVRSGDAEALVLLGQIHQASAVTTTPTERNSATSAASASIMSDKSYASEEEEVEEAEMLLQKRQEEQELATRCFQQAAAMGHVEAMFLAAQSWHAQQQFAAALEFYERAAACGHALSRVMRARYRIAGLGGLTADPEEGYKVKCGLVPTSSLLLTLLQKELVACAQDDMCVDAYNSLGQCHELGLGTTQDDRLALEWYIKSAEKTQDAEAMFRIGQMHAQGRAPAQKEQKQEQQHHALEAMQWFRFACESRNHPRAHYCLGLYYLRGITSEDDQELLLAPDTALALEHFHQAAAQNDRDAMVELGMHLLQEEQETEAVSWLERAAQLNSVDAQRELGKIYHGNTQQDFEKAYDLFCRAAQQGDRTSTLFIGIYHEHGIHVPPSAELAQEWYQVAIQLSPGQTWWLAELALARLLHQQHGFNDEAFALFQRAAPMSTSAGIMVARYDLKQEEDTAKHPEAAALLLRYAEAGESSVFLPVAECYAAGRGLPKNLKKAFEWYGRILAQDESSAEDEDLSEALTRLAEFYRLGHVVPVDLEKSIDLYRLAAEKGSEEAQAFLEQSTLLDSL